MSEARKSQLRQFPASSPSEWREELEYPRRDVRSGPSLMVVGLTLLGLSAAAWYYLGPDVKRYLRIRNM